MSGSLNTQRSRRACGVLASALFAVSVAVACTEEPPAVAGVSDEPSSGGTVTIMTERAAFSSLDPQTLFVADLMNVSRLITRTLTAYVVPSEGGDPELMGDLATDVGKSNEDYTEWTFTLREGVKWETGEEITCEDLRYGVLRNYEIRADKTVFEDSPPYVVEWLDVPEDYRGPRIDGDLTEKRGVICDDDHTIRFELNASISNFAAAAAMPAFAPVPEEADTWADYGDDPVSSGPYKLTEYEPGADGAEGHAVFERNEHWDAETDPVRVAHPDRIEYVLGVNRELVAQQIVSDNPDYANAILYENVPANYIQQVINDDELMARTVEGATGTIRYMAINSDTVSNIECRKALVIGFNKRKFQEVYGGEVFGDFATTVISPSDPGYAKFDVFGLADNPEGDLERASQLLADAGDCPMELSLDAIDTPSGRGAAETVQQTYRRLGITITLNLMSPDTFFPTINDLSKQGDLTLAGWIPDWPGGSGTLPAMYHSESIKADANNNYSRLAVEEIDRMIDEAVAAGNTKEAYAMWGIIDERIAEEAVTVPIVHSKVLTLCGKDVRGAHLHPQYGGIDLTALGVAG